MRRTPLAISVLLGLGMLGLRANAALPPSTNPLSLQVFLSSDSGGLSYTGGPLLDVSTGEAALTLSETDQQSPVAPGVEYDLQIDVDADLNPTIAYTFTLVNGSDMDLPVYLDLSCPMEPYDQQFEAQQSVIVTATDVNGGGVTVTPNGLVDFSSQTFAIQQAFASGADFINPQGAQTLGGSLGNDGLINAPVGAGETRASSDVQSVPTPPVFVPTPDGKFNLGKLFCRFILSAGDTVTIQGLLEIAPDLGGGGGGGGGGTFGAFSGTLSGKQQAKAKKITKLKDKDHSQDFAIDDDSFSLQVGGTAVGGGVDVKKNGKLAKLSMNDAEKAQLVQALAALLTGSAGVPVTVELTKEPKGKVSIKKDGAKVSVRLLAKFKATSEGVTKPGSWQIKVKGSLDRDE